MKGVARHLYFWVVLAILAGGTLGYVNPSLAVKLKPLGDGFIALVKMLIGPVIFCTVVLGIAGAGDMKKVGRVGGKALLYFEVVSTIALIIGLIGRQRRSTRAPASTSTRARSTRRRSTTTPRPPRRRPRPISSCTSFPRTFFDAFTGSGDLLQVLLVAVLFGYAMTHLGAVGKSVHKFIEECSRIFFAMMNAIMKLAPLGAGGAMAFTIGNYGLGALKPLAALMGSFYLTCLLFIFVVLGTIAARVRLQHRPLHRLHPRRAPHRARHLVVRVRARAADAASSSGSAARSPSWDSSCRRATRSTSTARTST